MPEKGARIDRFRTVTVSCRGAVAAPLPPVRGRRRRHLRRGRHRRGRRAGDRSASRSGRAGTRRMKPQPRTGCAPSLPGGACRFAGFARHPLRVGGAAGTAGSRVLINPGDFLRYRGQGRRSGDDRLAQLPRAFDLVLHSFCAWCRCPGLRPFPTFQRGHEAIGALAQDKTAITDQERGDMLALAARMKMDDLVPHALGFCPQARQPGTIQIGLSSPPLPQRWPAAPCRDPLPCQI